MHSFKERFEKLNEKQREAVSTIDGAVMVIAGPGSGKTELLAIRTANILKEVQVSPHNILLLTFTESAAFNMRERLVNLIGDTAYKVAIYTFHAFAGDIINKFGELFFNGANYRPATDVEKISIIESKLESLPKGNSLASKHFEKGFVYTSDILSCIASLKKGNLNASEFRDKINNYFKDFEKINKVTNVLEECLGARNFEKVFETYVKFYGELKSLNEKINSDYLKYLLNTLDLEIVNSQKSGEYKNLNDWRDEFFVKENNTRILKDSRKEKIQKWLELSDIYEQYSLNMHEQGLYDFEDMIFLVARELKNNENLKNELSEKFQYIMVDEFQDTNESQFSLIYNLTNSFVHENNPNILIVGDDDQAIYKFQGAELSNIFKFKEIYPRAKVIVLNKNYRSTQQVLDFARNSILKGFDRLEVRDKSLSKELISHKSNFEKAEKNNKGKIVEEKFENESLEFDFVAKEIMKLIADDVNPKEISIIAKKHDTLKNFSNVLNIYKIPYSYEKKENVLDKQHIKELLTIVEFVNSVYDKNIKDFLLPEILSFSFWGLERLDIWQIAEKVRVYNEEKPNTWLTCILNSENLQIKQIGFFLLELSDDAKNIPLEHLLDKIIGTTDWEFEGEYSDLEDTNNNLNTNFISPYKSYYFGKDNFLHNKPEYLNFLFSLRTFIGALREFKQGTILKARDLEDFLNVYKNNEKLSLTMQSPFASSQNSIVLQTAHKAKGLEYEYVFILNANEKDWNGRGVINKIGFPKNLKLLPESDNYDDKLRLFYVTITRAKHTIYLTYTKEKLNFIMNNDSLEKPTIDKKASTIDRNILQSLEIKKQKEFVTDEKVLLQRLLENYQMPVTHLTNFLNLGKVGPDKFIEQNLLRFPQAMSESSIFGSAMHLAIQNFYLYYKNNKKLPSKNKFSEFFESALTKYKMPENLFSKHLEFGKQSLEIYFKEIQKNGNINETDLIEYNFKNEGVHFLGVNATGKIDKIIISKDEIVVADFKTGKSFNSWEKKDSEYSKIKLHFYKYQLAYYVLLINHSRSFKDYKVNFGQIEFLEPDEDNKINILKLEIEDELLERVKKLAHIIYNKILNLDFPNTDKYILNIDGTEKVEIKLQDILDFEEDLLSDKI